MSHSLGSLHLIGASKLLATVTMTSVPKTQKMSYTKSPPNRMKPAFTLCDGEERGGERKGTSCLNINQLCILQLKNLSVQSASKERKVSSFNCGGHTRLLLLSNHTNVSTPIKTPQLLKVHTLPTHACQRTLLQDHYLKPQGKPFGHFGGFLT